MKKLVFVLLLAMLAPNVSFGQTRFPQTVWTTVGNTSPIEDRNFQTQSYFEQGIKVNRKTSWSLVPYAALGVTTDTQGLFWNNKVNGQLGLQLNKNVGSMGLISVRGAYLAEDRWAGDQRKYGKLINVSDWFGWNGQGKDGVGGRLPGNTWAVVGINSSVEENNVSAQFHIQQGLVIARIKRNGLVPFVVADAGVDAHGYDYNNRLTYGSGIEYQYVGEHALTELGVKLVSENRFDTGLNKNRLVFFTNFWFGRR